MSYVFSHAFIPLAILFIFSRGLNLDTKNIVIFSFFGIFPDSDVILMHRMTFHNIFILLIPLLFLIVTKKKEMAGLISFYLLSHLILDLFNGGISALYPIYGKIFFINAEIISSYKMDGIMLFLNYGIKGDFINTVKDGNGYGIVSSENFGMIVLLLIMILVFLKNKIIKEKYNRLTKVKVN